MPETAAWRLARARRPRAESHGWLAASNVIDAVVSGAVAGVLSGAPSTVWTLARRGDLLESTAAAGTLLLGEDASRRSLIVAGAVAHSAISLWWGFVLSRALPRRHIFVAGAAAGLGIAALDLGVIARRYPRIRALPRAPQVADHVAFGVSAAAVLARRWRRN